MGYSSALPIVITSSLPSKDGGTIDLAFELLEVVGEGGMASVYKARDLNPPEWYRQDHGDAPRFVAIKYPRVDLYKSSEEASRRFIREVELLSSVQHENVVRVINPGEDQSGLPFYVMELIENAQSVNSLINEYRLKRYANQKIKGSLVPAKLIMEFLRQALAALRAIHDAGIVHRDIKPDNFLIQETAAGRRFILTDFGISKDLKRSDLTREGCTVGTPYYMSAEQVRQGIINPETNETWTVGPWSDIWSLGVVTYELVTGELPFTADIDEPGHIMAKISTESIPPTPLEDFVDEPDASLKHFIELCLVKAPWDRPPNAGELLRLLGRYKTTVSLSVPPPRRNPLPASQTKSRPALRAKSDAPRHSPSRWLVALVGIGGLALVLGAYALQCESSKRQGAPPASTEQPASTGVAPLESATPRSETSVSALREPGNGPTRGSKLLGIYEQGQEAFKRGNCARATLDMKAVLIGHPAYPPPFLVLGECARRAGKLDEARGHYARYLGFKGVPPLPPEAQKIMR